MRPRARFWSLAAWLWVCVALASCADAPGSKPPQWIDLSRDFVPTLGPPAVDTGTSHHAIQWTPVPSLNGHMGGWLTEHIEGSQWTAVHPRIWHAKTRWASEQQGYRELRPKVVRRVAGAKPSSLRPVAARKCGAAFASEGADYAVLFEKLTATLMGADASERFISHDRDLWLILDEAEVPGNDVTVRLWVDLGQPDALGWRVFRGSCSGRGIPLMAGRPETIETPIPPASVLRMGSLSGSWNPPGRLRVRLDDEVIWEEDIGSSETEVTHVIHLPPEGRASARLAFEFASTAGRLVLMEPMIGPKDVGTYASRPWVRSYPDIVLVSADTFRADNLAHNGGAPHWAPHLNAFAEHSLCFTEARTAATWTLPAHAALFTARMPRQVSMFTRGSRLPIDVVTLADHFSQAGYRVAAITERGFVSRSYGMDQGFGHFEEHRKADARTLRGVNEALARDDGRPLLLFVHSYRAHGPYVASAKARDALSIAGDLETHQAVVNDREPLAHGTSADGPVADALAATRRMYRGASYDMDALFGQFVNAFESAGLLENGYLAFVSDHGESFGEHGVVGHGAGVWEEETRVPIMFRGPDIEGELRPGPSSLLDVPRTLATLAGIPPSASWAGVDLTASPSPRPIAFFQCGTYGVNYTGIVDGGQKIIMTGDLKSGVLDETAFAYDLRKDPGEFEQVDPKSAWPAALDQRLRPVLEHLSAAEGKAETALVDARHAAELRAMGYAGVED